MANFSLNNLKFEDVKAQIIEFLKSNSEYYATFDFEGSNLNYIVDAMAFVSMQMSYQVANVANNIFLDSTEIRKNAVSIAKTMGYRPKRIIPSRSDIEITYKDTADTFTADSYIKIPAGSSFISNNGNYYLNESDIVLTYKDKNTLFGGGPVFQGIKKQFNQISNGLPFQSLIISSSKVSEMGFNLYIQDSITKNPQSILWTELANTFSLQNKNSYLLEEDLSNEGFVKIQFGDGSILNYPDPGKIVYIEYQEALGTKTNGEFLTTIPSIPASGYEINGVNNFYKNNLNSVMTLSSNKSYNGQDIESIDSIRKNAPINFANVGRLVTENDYNSFLNSYKFLSKAKAIGGDILFPGDQTKLGDIYITGLPATFDGLNLSSLYLTPVQEAELAHYIGKFKIISTNINFYKPSYVYTEVYPYIEVDKHSTPEVTASVSGTVYNSLQNYVGTTFTNFNPQFRHNKFVSNLESISEIVSTDFDYKFYFIIARDTFYSNARDIINLPIIVTSYDSNFNVASAESFVRTNEANRIYLGMAPASALNDSDKDNFNALDYTKDMSTIYGKINHDTLERYMYNIDSDDLTTCEVRLTGENIIANIFNYENHAKDNIVTNLVTGTNIDGIGKLGLNISLSKSAKDLSTYIYNSSISGHYDEYTVITSDALTAGTIYRTDAYNNGYLGLIRKASDIPVSGTAQAAPGAFMTSVINTWIDPRNPNDIGWGTYQGAELRKGETVIFDGTQWQKATYQGTISAVSGINFYDSFPAVTLSNMVYLVNGSASGTIGGYVDQIVTGGDKIIFHYSATADPQGQWTKVNNRATNQVPALGLDGGNAIPTIVDPFEIHIVTDVDTTTTFGGRTNTAFEDQDIIYYNSNSTSAEIYKWIKACNFDTWETDIPDNQKIAATSVSGLHGLSMEASAAGTSLGVYAVTGDPGNFGDSSRIEWPFDLTPEEQIAVSGDILIYKGKVSGIDKWAIYLQQYSNLYALDGNEGYTLPITATYGDEFGISVSGDFDGLFETAATTADHLIYIDNNEWLIETLAGSVSTASSIGVSALPKPGTIGDILMVDQDGGFEYNTIPGIFSPSGDQFVQGDYLIFTGDYWTKLNEYSFSYQTLNDNLTYGKTVLNDLGLNAVFYYKFSPDLGQYQIYFKDIYDEAILGNINYTAVSGDYSKVGKFILNENVTGSLWINNPVTGSKTVDLFTNNLTPSKIQILPKIRDDKSEENDFDTSFDNYLIVEIKNPQVHKTIL